MLNVSDVCLATLNMDTYFDVQKISKSGLLIRLYWPFLDVKKHTTQKERRADFIKNRLIACSWSMGSID
jgi:hypothetical protein